MSFGKTPKGFYFLWKWCSKKKALETNSRAKRGIHHIIFHSADFQEFWSFKQSSLSPCNIFFFKQNINTEAEVCIKEELVGCVFGKETHQSVYPSFLETWVSATVFKSKFEWCRKQTCRRNASKIKILVFMIIASFLFNIDLI